MIRVETDTDACAQVMLSADALTSGKVIIGNRFAQSFVAVSLSATERDQRHEFS